MTVNVYLSSKEPYHEMQCYFLNNYETIMVNIIEFIQTQIFQ